MMNKRSGKITIILVFSHTTGAWVGLQKYKGNCKCRLRAGPLLGSHRQATKWEGVLPFGTVPFMCVFGTKTKLLFVGLH